MTQRQFQERMTKNGVSASSVMLAPEQIIGRILRQSVKQNQPFLTTDLFLEGGRPEVSQLLKPGYRAVNLQIPAVRGGDVTPRSMVDVLFRSTPQNRGESSIPEMTMTLCEAVEVLAVEQGTPPGRRSNPNSLDLRYINGRDFDPGTPPTVTLAVTLEQANMLRTVEGRGEIVLIERSPGDTSISMNRHRMTLDQLLEIQPRQTFRTEIYRRGSRQTMNFGDDGTHQHAPPAAVDAMEVSSTLSGRTNNAVASGF
jgi:Flp pilus assembly protein CpaB